MTCPHCGSSVERGRVICPGCKEPLGAAIALAAAQMAAEARDDSARGCATLQLPAVKGPVPPDAEADADAGAHEEGRGPSTLGTVQAPPSDREPEADEQGPVPPTLPAVKGFETVAPALDEPRDLAAPGAVLEAPAVSSRAAPPPPRRVDRPLRAGEVVAGRFEVTAFVGRARFGVHYHVRDPDEERLLSLWVARAEEPGASVAEKIALALARAHHRNLARTLSLWRDADRLYALTEHLEGVTLAGYLRQKGGKGLPVASAVNVALQLASALRTLHAFAAHGALALDAVFVLASGRLKLAGVGLGAAIHRGSIDQMRESDQRALCAILYELLAGAAWTPEAPPVGRVRPEIPVAIDTIVQRGLGDRPLPAEDFYHALARAAGARPLAPEYAAPPPPPEEPAGPPPDPERWIVVRGHLDYGPYTFEQLRREVNEGRLTPDDVLKSVATGARKRMRETRELAELVALHEKRLAAERARAEAEHKARMRRRYRMLRTLRTGAITVAVAAGVAWVLAWRMETPDAVKNLPPLFAEPSVRASARVSVPPVLIRRAAPEEETPAPGRKRRRRKARPSESAMSTASAGSAAAPAAGIVPVPVERPPPPAELDFSASDARGLAAREEAKDLIRRGSARLRPCFDREAQRVPGLRGSFTVSFSVAPNGRAYGIHISGPTTSALDACIRAMLTTMRFPSFAGLPLQAEYPYGITSE